MSINEPQSTESQDITLVELKEWLIQTTQLFAKFAIILIFLGSALAFNIVMHLSLVVSYALIIIIGAVLFIMIILFSTKNIVHHYLKTSTWGRILTYLLVALINGLSYLWAIGEINRLFLVDPSNLALTTTALTATQSFRYTTIVLLISYLAAVGIYVYFSQKDSVAAGIRQKSINHRQKLRMKLFAGMIFVSIVISSMIALDNFPKYRDQMIQIFAVNIDFYNYHTCTGDGFKNIDGILFLSASEVLVAKKTEPMTWQFKKLRCEP